MIGARLITQVVERVARRAIEDYRASLPEQHWANFTLATALMDVWQASGDNHHLDCARHIVDWYVDRSPWWHEKRIWRWSGITAAALKLHTHTGVSKYRDFGLDVADSLFRDPVKVQAGTTPPHGEEPVNTWIDLLYFACPASAQAAVVSGDQSHFDAVGELLDALSGRLLDKETSLFYPYWANATGYIPDVFWGRGIGWAVVALAEVLAVIPNSHPRRPRFLSTLQDTLNALRRHQDPSGHWHTAVDRCDSYLETSATAMFAFAMARGANRGFLTRDWLAPAAKAWTALQDKVSAEGQVFDTSLGTPPAEPDSYLRIERGVVPYGTAFFLELGVEMSRV